MGRTKSSLSALLVLIFVGVAAVGAYVLLRDLQGPEVAMSPDNAGRIGLSQELTLRMQDPAGIRSVQVVVKRGGQSMTVLRREFGDKALQAAVSFNLTDTKLPEGAFELEVKANDGSYAGFGKGNSTIVSLPLRLDSTAPRIAVKTVPPSIRRGGAALILYTVSEEAGKTGVSVGERFFPGYRQPNGAYACLFPFPYFLTTANFSPEIMAEDLAGNSTSSRLLVNAQARTYKDDTLTVGDNFLNAKADELARLCPEGANVLEQYICVNNKERIRNDEFLLTLGQDSAPTFLWDGRFLRLPKSAVKANFADSRTYNYTGTTFSEFTGKKIDAQTHLGLDLASTAQAEVPATSSGRVVYAHELGIYGNLVVIDHGVGLMSVYSHLTEIRMEVGQEVAGGDIVGTTGVTGLAGGDHVHFGFLVGGIPVQPLEWLDPQWVRNNISNRINTPI